MQKAAPSFGRIAAMAVFALSCFGLLLFLWLAFGGPVPLKPKGYRFTASFAEATQLAKEADVRISGVPVGKVKTIEPDKQTGPLRSSSIELDARYAPLPSDARAILRQKTLLGETYVELTPGTPARQADPRGRAAGRRRRCRRPSSSTRSCAPFDPRTRDAFQAWMQTQAQAIDGHGRDLNDALGNLGAVRRGRERRWSTSSTASRARVRRLVSNTGVVFGALTERDGQLRALIENSNTVFATTAARDRELQAAFVALPTFERESRQTLDAADRVRRRHQPAGHPAAPGGARAVRRRCRTSRRSRPTCKRAVPRPRPADRRRRKAGFPAAEQIARATCGRCSRQIDPALRQLDPDPRLPRRSTSAS